jgi:hypothetical protein
MPTFKTNIAMDVRAYGSVSVEADTLEQAVSLITAEYVAKNFEPHGSGSDICHQYPSDIWAEGLETDGAEKDDCFDIDDGDWMTVDPKRAEIAKALRDGQSADIWYDPQDASDVQDASAIQRIEATQSAMSQAADLLDPPITEHGQADTTQTSVNLSDIEGYTVWISALDSAGNVAGTHHVSYHIGTVEEARAAAINETQSDWCFGDDEDLHVIGIVKGDIEVIEWDDRS